MHTFHIAATSVAFGLLIFEWQRTRNSREFSISQNWPLIAFALALVLSLPSSFISLFQEHKEALALVTQELNWLSGASLGISISIIVFSTIKKVTDVGSVLLLVSAFGIAFFYLATTKLAKLADERWMPSKDQSTALP